MVDFIQALAQHIKGSVTDLQRERATECASCDDKEKRVYADILNSKMVEVNGYVCTRCDCPLPTKIFAKDKKNICNKWRR